MHSSSNESTSYRNIILMVIAVIALVAGVWLARQQNNATPKQPPELKTGTFISKPRPTAPFQLEDYNQKPFTLKQLQGKWSFVFFGYTNCPDVCPATMIQFQLMAKKLADKPKYLAKTQFVFISVDPERDNPKYLKTYVQFYNKDFIGVTGKPDELLKLSRQFGVIYMKIPQKDDPKNYLIDHSAAIILLNPEGNLVSIFSAPHKAADMADDLVTLQDYFKG